MLTRVSRFIVGLALVFPLCASAQWAVSNNDIYTICPTPPCKVLVNPGNDTNSAAGIEVGGSIVVQGSSPFVALYSSSGAASFAVDAPTSQPVQLFLRSGAQETIYLRREASTSDFTIFTGRGAPQERMRITNAGKVSIGTTVAAEDLFNISAPSDLAMRMTHTNPSSAMNGIFFYEGTSLLGFINQRGTGYSGGARRFNIGNADSAGDTALFAGANQRMLLLANGNVGIGTAAPTAALSVSAPINGQAQMRIGQTGATGAITAYITNPDAMSIGLSADVTTGQWYAQSTTAAFLSKNEGKFVVYGSAGNTIGTPAIGIRELLSIDITSAVSTFGGAVAIGAPLPVGFPKKLYVVGGAEFVGSVVGTDIRANYQDVAEWVPSSENLSPGTVVVIDKRSGNTVKASVASYDTSVAGVVSAQPGILLGEEGASKEQIATTGRVRVRVDASKGSIEIGDLLVTSDISGTAMKSAPIDIGGFSIHRPGTILGKALEPLDHGVGEILVLLSMQ